MNTSNIFKKAHALTKATIQTGDSYSATFAICLKVVYAESSVYINDVVFKTEKSNWVAKADDNGVYLVNPINGKKDYLAYGDTDTEKVKIKGVNSYIKIVENFALLNAFINCHDKQGRRLKKVVSPLHKNNFSKDDGAIFDIGYNENYCYNYANCK